MKNRPNKVRITYRDTGYTKFNRLIDDGGNVMRFCDGFGFIFKDEIEPSLEVTVGWLSDEQFEAEKAKRFS